MRGPVEPGQYTSGQFADALDAHGLLASVGTTGDAYDNAMAESFVDTFKTELISDRVWRSRTQLELAIVEWVGWYNARRLHGELGDIPPVEYELEHALAAPSAISAPDGCCCRVAGAVARPGSHRTVLALFAHGSSGQRVANPAAGRFATSTYPQSSTISSWVGATTSRRLWRCSSTRRIRPRAVKYVTGMALSTAGLWLSAHVDLRPA